MQKTSMNKQFFAVVLHYLFRFVLFRFFVSFRFVSFRFVSFRFVSFCLVPDFLALYSFYQMSNPV